VTGDTRVPFPTRRRPIAFTFDDRPIPAYEGDSIASALFAAGVRIFSRSFKYHRPRGLLCCAGRCPNCLMNVDGTPNVRTCVTPAREGMRVRHQNAWPWLEHDALSVLGLFDRLLPVGFYYKTLIHPRALWPLYERILRAVAGIGVVDPDTRPEGYRHEYRYTDVAVVGGGPAGREAALAAAREGARVTLIEEQEVLAPGSCRGRRTDLLAPGPNHPRQEPGAGSQELEAAGVTVWTGATAFGAYEGNLIGIQRGRTLIELRYRRLVLATGAFERMTVFPGNDLPGVMLGTGAQRLLRRHGVRPGRRAVIATCHDGGLELAQELAAAGVEVAAVLDSRAADAIELPGDFGLPILPEATLLAAHGRRHLTHVQVARSHGASRRIACDLLCLSLGWEPATALLAHALDDPTDGAILLAGSVAGAASIEECLAQAEAVGRAAANPSPQPPPRSGEGEPLPQEFRSLLPVSEREAGGERSTAPAFVCLCEDVTTKDVAQAIEEGFDHVETLKRYSTASMGPCQGKMCRAAVSQLCARFTTRTPEQVGLSRARPPAQPVTLGALGAEHAAPVRRTPMHHRHVALGARFTDLGEWKRAEVYSDVDEECRAVRERVGLIDVGSLGKLEVAGEEADALLDKVYTNRCTDLRVGRVRYGVVCDDAGIILDDGTIARLGDARWFLTTTSGGVEAMEQWLRWWAVPGPGGRRPCVHVTNLTAARAAVNLAGPRSREVLARLTDLDLSPGAFPYLAAREGTVAGVPALLLRIGFVGELGYEIHYPAEFGVHVWDAVLEAGREFGILPFGVEAQRILRLEKQHLIVGQDTDALSNPLDAGMPWVVRWDKDDFIGKRSLLRVRAAVGDGRPTTNDQRPTTARSQEPGARSRLVGFEIADRSLFVPEGSQVVEEGRPVGRVTSFRRSPTLGKGIGLAWVPEAAAREGGTITLAAPIGEITASVTLRPFYDPEGRRVRS
jgi:sarcosine oxidase subunit alpha